MKMRSFLSQPCYNVIKYTLLLGGIRMNLKLTNEQIETYLQQTKDWKRVDEKWIQKKYRFKQFMEGIQFINHLAQFSEEVNHHPFIAIDFRLVTVKITS